MTRLRFAPVRTVIGPMLVAESDLGIAAISRSPSLADFLRELGRRFGAADLRPGDLDLTWLTDALSGRPLPPVEGRRWDDVALPALPGGAVPPSRAGRRRLVGVGRGRGGEATAASCGTHASRTTGLTTK